jgi:hypothetical protein
MPDGFKYDDSGTLRTVPQVEAGNGREAEVYVQQGGSLVLIYPPSSDPTASSLTIIDSAEDGDLSEYGGDTGQATVQSTTGVTDGSNAIEITASSSNFESIASTSGLNNYPGQGDTNVFVVDGEFDTTGEQHWSGWAAQSATSLPNGYYIQIVDASTQVDLVARGGSGTLGSDSYSSSLANVPLRIVWLWDTTDVISAHIYRRDTDEQVAAVSARDTSYTSGGIAFLFNETQNTTANGYWDYERQENEAEPHHNASLSVNDIVTTSGIRERPWVVRPETGNWHLFVSAGSNNYLHHYTSSDGETWSADSNNSVNSTNTEDVVGIEYGGNWYIYGEEELSGETDLRIWEASTLDASSWTAVGNIDVGLPDGIGNPNIWYEDGTWYLLVEEVDLDGPDFTRLLTNTNDPTNDADWSDAGRVLDIENRYPNTLFRADEEYRMVFWDSGVNESYIYRPVRDDYTAWEPVSRLDLGSYDGVSIQTPKRRNGYDEVYPDGPGTPWYYIWDAATHGGDGDDNLALYKS